MNTANTHTVRINVTVPEKVWNDLEQEIPNRGKSAFITEAIEEKLRSTKREKAFKRLASLPPTFVDIPNGATYIHEMRQREDKERSKRLGI